MQSALPNLSVPTPPGGWKGHDNARYVPIGPAVELVVTAAGLAEGGRPRDPLAIIVPTPAEAYWILHRHCLGITPFGGELWLSITGHHGLDQPDQVHTGKNLRSVPEPALGVWLIEGEHVRAGDVLVLQPARDTLRRARVVLMTLRRRRRALQDVHPAPEPPRGG